MKPQPNATTMDSKSTDDKPKTEGEDDESPFADWYREGKPIPVCHPLPYCSATIRFPDEDTIVWTVSDHKAGKTYEEYFDQRERIGATEEEMSRGNDDD